MIKRDPQGFGWFAFVSCVLMLKRVNVMNLKKLVVKFNCQLT